MKSNIKFIAPILVTVFFVLALAYGINTKFETILSIFSPSLTDTTDNPPDFTYNKDVSQMFNERGFFKSNGFSFDESEIINDFNGNLMYDIPLYSFKQAGEMKFDVKLTYNGSVGHQVILCDSAHFTSIQSVYYHNFNAPEWILSINGIAVQVYNFEPSFFTKTAQNNEIKDFNVNLLVSGYHMDRNGFKTLNAGERDRIQIMTGDGSLISLVNVNTQSYSGTYISESKESYYKAIVTHYETGVDSAYRNRIVELTLGDGLVYIFREYKRNYADMTFGATALPLRPPQILLLEEIKDKLGNKINLGYEFNQAPSTFNGRLYGHPLFVGASSNSTGNCSITSLYAGNLIKIAHTSSVNGSYFFQIDPAAYFTATDQSGPANNIAYFHKINNPLLQEATIQYYTFPYYGRSMNLIPNTWGNTALRLTLSNTVKRIKNFKNFLGGYREYTYYGNDTMTIFHWSDQYLFSSGYKGYGRDPFYTNMLSQKKDKDERSVLKSQMDIEYSYSDANSNKDEYPVDAADSYGTTRTTSSQHDTTLNNTPNQIKNIKNYKVYPVRFSTNDPLPPEPSVFEFSGVTKVLEDENLDLNNAIYEMTKYAYDTATSSGNYNGSYLTILRKNTVKGLNRSWTTSYTYDGSNNQYNNPITAKSETDPLGNKTEITFLNLDTAFKFNILTAGYNGETESDASAYYKIGLPTEILKKDGSNNVLAKSTSGYLRTQTDSKGYYGQLITEKVYAAPGFSSSIETNYEYYKNDTIGTAFYSGGTIPYKEGNLKIVKKPDGEEEVYYYHPISFFEDETYNPAHSSPVHPEISFRKKYSTGSVTIEKDFLVDNRLPIRIDNYKRINSSSVNLLKTVYFKYNEAGYPTKIINENRYVTELVYQPTHRISSITLPGDYSTQGNDTTPIINHFYYYDTVNVSCTGFGYRNELTSVKQLNFLNAPQYLRDCSIFYMWYRKTTDTMTFQHPAFIRFENVPVFNQVMTAQFSFPVFKYLRTQNGNPLSENNYYTTIKPFSSLGTVTQNLSCGGRNWFKSTTSAVENLSQNITIDTSASGTYKVQSYDVKDMLDNLSSYHKKLEGFHISAGLTNPPEPLPNHELKLEFINTFLTVEQWANEWYNWLQYAPKLSIYGEVDVSDTIKLVTIYGGTYLYSYEDANKSIVTYSRLSHSPNVLKKMRYFIDGFANIKSRYIFNNVSDSDKFSYSYNYLLKLASEIDGTGDTTWHSNDLLGRDSITTHQDHSFSTQGNQYASSITTTFYTISGGFVEKKIYTDETGRTFNKYFDAVGNLLREEKFVAGQTAEEIQNTDNPFDPDTTYEGQDIPGYTISLITDYKYDNLYRLTQVKTPGNKDIFYYYDGYGRQVQRRTTDAGNTYYSYDNNDNLILSQDANQRAVDSRLHTRRYYDALNRLLTIGDIKLGAPIGSENGPMGDTTLPFEFDSPLPADSIFIINVYDTITSAVYDIFNSNKPSDYGNVNYLKGQLVATAYRTSLSENWNYKFYRYDQRGNMIKVWHKIDGLGWKFIDYNYNSQNQATRLSYEAGQNDGKVFTYGYDSAGRLQYTNLYVGLNPITPEEETDYPSLYLTMASYTYNPDQQVSKNYLNANQFYVQYNYNNRNRVFTTLNSNSSAVFRYTLLYNANGNIRKQITTGNYRNNFNDNSDLWLTHIYDNSNRLVKSDRDSGVSGNTHDIINNYDYDGNFKNIKRYGSSNNLVDNFSYTYYTGTNRLKNIGSGSDYTYDANGNVTYDNLNRNSTYKYDWRNLLTEIRSTKTENGLFGPEDVNYWTLYNYDEAGNRMRKLNYKYVVGTPPGGHEDAQPGDTIVIDQGDGNGYWVFQYKTYYVRDITGKEIAIYNGNSIEQWNIYGLDNVGKINSDNKRYFYLKDHLGSIRAVLDTTNAVVSAQDYDPWGYPLENRTWQTNNTKYKFTGKEHDNENNYDYFGARYYDSRIANWTSIDPLFEKHLQWTPYNYVLRNPVYYFDPNGSQEAAVWKLTYEVAKKSIQTAAPLLGIPLGIPAFIANLVLSPEQFGHAELKDLVPQSPYIVGEEGFLESIIPTEVIVVTSLHSEGDLVKLTDKQVKDYVKGQGYTGEKSVEKYKEDVLGQEKIAKEKAGSYDVYKDKGSGKHYLKPKKQHEKKLPKIELEK